MANVIVESGNLPAKREHAGETVLVAKISLSASWSSGDVHRIGKIPHGAIITDAVFYPGAALPGTAVLKMGTSASQELFFASATYSVMARTTRNLGYLRGAISLSDDAQPRYDWVVAVATAGVSVGHVGDLIVRYVSNPTA